MHRLPSPLTRVLVALLVGACASCAEEPAAPTAAARPPATPAPEPAPVPALVHAEVLGPLAGTWWAFSSELPYTGFRVMLVNPSDDSEHVWEGSWISFDWRGTTSVDQLSRPSRAVAVTARRTGPQLVLSGPAPQIDQNGVPLGAKGTWELTLEATSLPGEPLRFSGRMLNPRVTGTEGVGVDVEQGFRTWQP